MSTLTPDTSRFTLLALLKRGQHSRVSLLKGSDGKVRVGRCLEQPGGATEAQLLEGLDREARNLRGLRLPHVVSFDQLVEGSGGTWMLFEYAAGTVLGQYQGRELSLSEAWIVHWIGCLLRGLEALHNQAPPLVLGYLEPFDIIVNDQALTIIDLGLFERVFPEISARGLKSHPFKAFMAPERQSAVRPAVSSDLYSVGALAFWLLTARAPVVKNPGSRSGVAAVLQECRPELTCGLTDLVLDMLSFYPSARPATAAEALERCNRLGVPVPDGPLPEATPVEIAFAAGPTNSMKQGDAPMQRPAPPAMSVGADLPAEAPPVRPAWMELLDDLAWSARGRPLLAILVILILIAPLGLWHPARPAPPSAAPLLTVVSGTAAVDPGSAQGHAWHYAPQVLPGETLLAPSSIVEARCGTTGIWLAQGAGVLCQRLDGSVLQLAWVSGETHLTTGHGGSVVMAVGTHRLELDPDTEAWVTPTSISCKQGRARWSGSGSEVTNLVAGSEINR